MRCRCAAPRQLRALIIERGFEGRHACAPSAAASANRWWPPTTEVDGPRNRRVRIVVRLAERRATVAHMRALSRLWLLTGAAAGAVGPGAAPFRDDMAQRTLACVACHGEQGRADP